MERQVAAGLICSDISLLEMVALRPKTPSKVSVFEITIEVCKQKQKQNQLVVLDGWTSLRLQTFGSFFLEELCQGVELETWDGAIESACVEISKTDRATCVAW